ncbi:MAG: hypothetical protein JWP34_2578 [Massilia sp.]|nr:hypothetical protein [Massilia sp.]MDB5908464.1 hypothetical protein [Massilia sp.]
MNRAQVKNFTISNDLFIVYKNKPKIYVLK